MFGQLWGRNSYEKLIAPPQLVDQNSTLKKEAGIAERKLLARNERIQNLEALLQDADRRLSVQNQKFEAQLQAVKERLDQARGKPEFFDVQVPEFQLVLTNIHTNSSKSGHIITAEFWPYCQAIERWRRCCRTFRLHGYIFSELCKSSSSAPKRGGRVSPYIRYALILTR